MSFEVNKVDIIQLLQPELLNENELRNILMDRCLRKEDLINLHKDQLLNIYNRLVAPLGQRTRKLEQPQQNGTDTTNVPDGIENISKRMKLNNDARWMKQLKSFSKRDNSVVSKKVQLKRTYNKTNDDGIGPPVKKTKQKICWP